MPSKRLPNLKQRTLYYRFKIQYNPGKWHRGPDACSRNPVLALAILSDTDSFIEEPELEGHIESVVASIISSSSSVGNLVSFEDMLQVTSSDPDYQIIKQAVSTGFSKSRGKLDPTLKLFWNVRNRLSLSKDGLLIMDG